MQKQKQTGSFKKLGTGIKAGRPGGPGILRRLNKLEKLGKLSKTGKVAAGFCRLKKKVGRDSVSASRFLYVAGIQNVRVLKRLHRRTARFFSPLLRLCSRLFTAVLEHRIAAAHKELASLRIGWAAAKNKLREARGKGFWSALAEFFRLAGRSFAAHKKIVFSLLNVAAPVAAVFVLAATVRYWSGLNYGLVLVNNGARIATIRDESTYEKATELVNQRMVHDLAKDDAVVRFAPEFTLTVSDGQGFTPASAVCDSLIQQSNGIIEEASGLYVDGQLFGVVKSSADLRFILQDVLNSAKGNDGNVTVRFEKNVEMVNGLFPTTSLISSDKIRNMVRATSSAEVTYVVREGDTVSSIAKANRMTVDELNKLNGNKLGDSIHPGDVIKLESAVPVLGIELQKTQSYQVPLAYSTVTERDDTKYTDYSRVKSEGKNGVQQCVDKITLLNGEEIKRESVSRTTLTSSVNRVVVVGTKKRPANAGAGVSTGKLMWPVPSLRTITTYFTWRWGSFHYGIDISGSGASGKTIVAADGGTVTQAGWESGYGYRVVINHGGGLTTLYGHSSKLLVKAGQRVSKGQAIALVGSTGNSTGAHCHFEIRKNGVRVNPLSYVG